MSLGRQIGTFLLLGLGVGLGFAAVDSLFGQRKVIVKDVYSTDQQRIQQQQQSNNNQSSVHIAETIPDCTQAEHALQECESRHGIGSSSCRFFRVGVDDCHTKRAAIRSIQEYKRERDK